MTGTCRENILKPADRPCQERRGTLLMKRTYPTIDMARTGRNIKMIMQAKGFTVKDVQKFLGLGTSQGIYHWFNGRSMPTLDNLYALSELFCLPMDVLLIGNRKYGMKALGDPACRRMYIYHERLQGMAA